MSPRLLHFLNIQYISILREESTSAGLHAGHLIFVKLEFGVPGEKRSEQGAGTDKKLNPHMAPGRHRTRVAMVKGERSHHYAIPAPLIKHWLL